MAHRAYSPVDTAIAVNNDIVMEFPVSRLPARAVGVRIRELRTALGISQQDLAELAAIHASNLGKIERGEANPNLDTLARIATALESSVSELTRYVTSEHVAPVDRRITVSDLIQARSMQDTRHVHNAIGHSISRPSA